jgi:DNA (cytosine-5)-methyltransferase 1
LGHHIVLGDIRAIPPSSSIPSADVVIGGFPCQGFSIVGTRRLDDERNFLYREMKRVIRDIRPAFFVAENVRGLLNMQGGKVISAMLMDFRSLGYKVDYRSTQCLSVWRSPKPRAGFHHRK